MYRALGRFHIRFYKARKVFKTGLYFKWKLKGKGRRANKGNYTKGKKINTRGIVVKNLLCTTKLIKSSIS